ncbi:MAG: type III toxin-antitoxin system ToxN/AbiQ family toxin [Clostridiales bacterium]|nr:type III toxin-antitoxin system ToxN/AbiQ family toxin [Clostridiales bacterium]
MLNFYEVDSDYINYLIAIDGKVPKINYSAGTEAGVNPHDKFLCGIVLVVEGREYFAPISSFKTPQRTNIIIKDVNGKDVGSIRFSFMIPVPPGAAAVKRIENESSDKYRNLLNMELRYVNRNTRAILTRARYVYNSAVMKKDPSMIKNCCNFKVLETACAEYAKTHSGGSGPTGSSGPGC